MAEQLIQNLGVTVKDYRGMSHSYGSGVRDEAMILEVLTQMKKIDKAGSQAKRIAERLSSGEWFGTQTVAFSLMAVGKFVGDNGVGKPYTFTYQINDSKMVNGGSSKPMMQLDVPIDGTTNKSVAVKNTSNGLLYARLITTGQPLIGCLLYTSPSPRDATLSRMPSSA